MQTYRNTYVLVAFWRSIERVFTLCVYKMTNVLATTHIHLCMGASHIPPNLTGAGTRLSLSVQKVQSVSSLFIRFSMHTCLACSSSFPCIHVCSSSFPYIHVCSSSFPRTHVVPIMCRRQWSHLSHFSSCRRTLRSTCVVQLHLHRFL